MSDSVFVLGATLDPGDLRAFCDATGRDPGAVRAYGRAYLPDHEPAFVDRGAASGAIAGALTASALPAAGAGVVSEQGAAPKAAIPAAPASAGRSSKMINMPNSKS